MSITLSTYTLLDVWTPIRTDIATQIKTAHNAVTTDTLTDAEAAKIEALLYNYCHALLNCTMQFSSDVTLGELQTMLKGVVKHRVFYLVNEWKGICKCLDIDAGKLIHQESYYDVADTPRIETKDYNELDIVNKQVESMYLNSKAIKDFYNEVKELVITLYI